MSSKTYRKRILELFSSHPRQIFKPKELARRLSVPPQEYRDFRDLLRRMAGEREIAKHRRNKYGLLQKSSLVEGELHVKTQGYGFVLRPDGEDVFVSEKSMGTALHGDIVRVQLFAQPRGRSPEGRVLEVVKRARQNIIGVYHRDRHFGFVVPDEVKIQRDIYVADEDAMGAQPGQKVAVQITDWADPHLNPEGRVVEILGWPEEPGVDVLSVAKAFDLPTAFPPQVETEAESIPRTIPASEYERRLDLRAESTFTIDPEDAKDFDDAVSLQVLPNGNYLLGVHIADVSYYVPEGSAIDHEALKRGTSVYLVDRVVPMLPEKLSNDICSLRPNEDRLTFSVLMEVDRRGEVVDYQIRESVLRSRRRFTYEEVQEVIDGRREDEYRDIIRQMHSLSQILIEKRRQLGSLDFDTPEVKITLDKQGYPIDIRKKPRLDSHRLIEEFMLLANKTVTEHIALRAPEQNGWGKLPFIYRIHERPDPEKVKAFAEFVHALGYDFGAKKRPTPRSFQRFLETVQGTDEEVLIEDVLLRSMMKAKYSTKNVGHFGLAFRYYTHFTSPIRRYPDLAVHRLLKEYTKGTTPERLAEFRDRLPQVCTISSEREIVAQDAERESVKIKQVEFMAGQLGEEFEGIISGVVPFGIFVEITQYLVEGLVHVSDLGDDYYLYDEKNYALVGRSTDKVYRLGDPVRVRVMKVDREERLIDFVLVEEEPPKGPKGRKRKMRRGR